MLERFQLDGHMLYDRVEDRWFCSKDKAYVHMFNVICEKLDKIEKGDD